MRILLAVPSARYVEVETFESIFNLKRIGEIELFIPNNYSIDVSRNIIARYAIENKFDYILWVDDDIILPEDTLTKLMAHGKDIVSGVYAYKILDNKNIVAKRFLPNEDDLYEDIPAKEMTGELLKVDAFGFGCVLTKTEVFTKIDYPHFIYTTDMGEDIYFCRKAQNAGYELFLDTSILCGHKGTVNYNIRSKV